MIKVENTVNGYNSSKDSPPIYVTSDQFDNRFIHIDICGQEMEVLGSDLITAIQNAMNTNCFGN